MVVIRGMRSDDLNQITQIEKMCFSLPWSRASLEKELVNELAYYQCAEEDDKIVGYMGMWRILDECHITNVAILPEYRNRGIAGMLISKMVEICRCSEISSMTLEVRETNIPAINLYEKFGFVSVGKRPRYYSKPIEDAIIMWKKL
ncbi:MULTISPECIES: ribosomal protein S18-alanine N-acetyltransferase [unclassified Sedimentibacter]|uniref:ribosomal protein S18-alanine N-acetyltransferase n=1 Tax=unclassified Sedimentibacter TaxID=2649220 RepID=UPI001BD5C339|nr:ribosomal protein S18-alanine N-acetyltransferase [Sedimentibacter sp. MB35-C1]WMJ76710.1 ribosomal protein S18-alanine N-acetyltransferase [Sedimentibacter sp. MB35-C1]